MVFTTRFSGFPATLDADFNRWRGWLSSYDGFLFSYFEYHGPDYAADMQRMAADPGTQAWWKLTDPCQEPLETRKPGEWRARMEELFHTD
jgi:L-rhamnose mutarotase